MKTEEEELEELKQWNEKQKRKLNKGLEIRRKKLIMQTQRRAMKTPKQIGLVQFVDFKWMEIAKVNGKFKLIGTRFGQGLQVENRVYLADGHYKLVNNRGFSFVRKYDGIPDWATDELKAKYAAKIKAFQKDTVTEPGEPPEK